MNTTSRPTPTGAPEDPECARLTPREFDVVRLLQHDLTNAEIAERMSVQLDTVKTMMNRLFKKLGISNRRQLREWYRDLPR